MAKEGRRKGRLKKSAAANQPVLPFEKENYTLFFAGLAIIVIGYICMGMGETYGHLSITVAPILVLIGYLILIPLSILYRKNESESA